MGNQNIVIGLLEVPQPMVTLGAVTTMIDIEKKQYYKDDRMWRPRKISDKQINLLGGFKIYVTANDKATLNQGVASDVLGTLIDNKSKKEKLAYHMAEIAKLAKYKG